MQAEEHARRVHGLLYSTDGRDELCERIVTLEELAIMLRECALTGARCDKCRENNDGYACDYIMRELGIEVD